MKTENPVKDQIREQALTDLGSEFQALERLRKLGALYLTSISNCMPLSQEAEVALEEINNTELSKIYGLAWAVANQPASTSQGLLVKARLLQEFADESPDDITSVLSRGLCEDILALFDPEEPGAAAE